MVNLRPNAACFLLSLISNSSGDERSRFPFLSVFVLSFFLRSLSFFGISFVQLGKLQIAREPCSFPNIPFSYYCFSFLPSFAHTDSDADGLLPNERHKTPGIPHQYNLPSLFLRCAGSPSYNRSSTTVTRLSLTSCPLVCCLSPWFDTIAAGQHFTLHTLVLDTNPYSTFAQKN